MKKRELIPQEVTGKGGEGSGLELSLAVARKWEEESNFQATEETGSGVFWGPERISILQNCYRNVIFKTGRIWTLQLLDRRQRREKFMATGHDSDWETGPPSHSYPQAGWPLSYRQRHEDH